ncbi:MAG: hypothetical protein ACWGMZ_07590, partial [Thermoguttaceae bacterium]
MDDAAEEEKVEYAYKRIGKEERSGEQDCIPHALINQQVAQMQIANSAQSEIKTAQNSDANWQSNVSAIGDQQAEITIIDEAGQSILSVETVTTPDVGAENRGEDKISSAGKNDINRDVAQLPLEIPAGQRPVGQQVPDHARLAVAEVL